MALNSDNKFFWNNSGWVCLFVKSEELHQKSLDLAENQISKKIPFLTSDLVIQETLTLLMARKESDAAKYFWSNVTDSKLIKIERIDEERFSKSGDFFCKQIDQGYSFVDVSSFLLMKELKIRKVVTLDNHFAKAGFQVLLTKKVG